MSERRDDPDEPGRQPPGIGGGVPGIPVPEVQTTTQNDPAVALACQVLLNAAVRANTPMWSLDLGEISATTEAGEVAPLGRWRIVVEQAEPPPRRPEPEPEPPRPLRPGLVES